jgi:hypothetical protein
MWVGTHSVPCKVEERLGYVGELVQGCVVCVAVVDKARVRSLRTMDIVIRWEGGTVCTTNRGQAENGEAECCCEMGVHRVACGMADVALLISTAEMKDDGMVKRI